VVAQRCELELEMEAAFHQLRSYARGRNLRLAEVARQVVTGELDPATTAGI
jgi:AmiR/NasT family two-component response regulator